MRPLYRAGQRDTCTVRSQPVILIADINTLKHGTCTPKVLNIVGHSIMVLVMAYDVKGSKSGFYSRS